MILINLKDGYVVLDSKTNLCYFKKITLDKFLKRMQLGYLKLPQMLYDY